jgi:hypothetical protein
MTLTQRKRFQISLRTGFVLTFLAGVMIGANVVPREGGGFYVAAMRSDGVASPGWVATTGRGCPLIFDEWFEDAQNKRYYFEWSALALNVFLALIVLTLTWLALEWRRLPVIEEQVFK